MKFVCLGYYDEKRFQVLSPADQERMIEECLAYDEVLKKNGNYVRGEALQAAPSAVTLRWRNGKAVVTDGPYAETREVLGGILVLEARDRDHAIELMSKHPGVRTGPFEIRPLDEAFTERVNAGNR